MKDETERYFFALNIPGLHQAPLRLVQDHLPKEGVRYTMTNYLHVTLKFLGELESFKVLEVKLKAKELVSQFSFSSGDLELQFTKAGFFWKGGVPSVIWVGVRLSERLYDFQRNFEEAMSTVGFQMEKRHFKPHITLARVRDVEESTTQNMVDELKNLGVKHELFQVKELCLMKSHLKKGAPPRYDVIERFPFN